jgi:hypothetical protein
VVVLALPTPITHLHSACMVTSRSLQRPPLSHDGCTRAANKIRDHYCAAGQRQQLTTARTDKPKWFLAAWYFTPASSVQQCRRLWSVRGHVGRRQTPRSARIAKPRSML